MADGITMLHVKDILEEDPARKYVVVSAPGKRYGGDNKVTDLLYAAHAELMREGHVGESYQKVAARFTSIVRETGITLDIQSLLEETGRRIEAVRSEAFTASRGEYLTGIVMAALLDVPFVDAATCVKFSGGVFDPAASYPLVKRAVGQRAVVAGFYGSDEEGNVVTFSRGGSDISGAVVARAVGADLYENWTDVSGFLACDPRIVPAPAGIPTLSYRELRELSYMGASVMHSESIFPVREADIPISIRNTFRPGDRGTLIVPTSKYQYSGRTVTGIAGRKNFSVIQLEKSLMNTELGFTYRVLGVLLRHGISFEHLPSGIDTMSFIIDSDYLKGDTLGQVLEEIRAEAHPDRIATFGDIALIAVVGHGMSRNVGTSARLFRAIARAGVNVRMIDQGSSELNIIVGVAEENYERTVRAVYDEFFGGQT